MGRGEPVPPEWTDIPGRVDIPDPPMEDREDEESASRSFAGEILDAVTTTPKVIHNGRYLCNSSKKVT